MTRLPRYEWDRVHELAVSIALASEVDDESLCDSRVEELRRVLDDLELRYGPNSRLTATRGDYADESDRQSLYQKALLQARDEGDTENETLILESLDEIDKDRKTAQPGATDNPDDAQRLREDL